MKNEYIGNPITKDALNRKLTGVCAGIAKHFNLPVWAVRTGTVIFGLFYPSAAIFGYLLASILMPTRKYY
ncbi:PspC domain-containing protein [Psychrosphaera aestuarii]|uniref:PspC domain-containing protein n=1 Tax=Psychrosphaera aestuarii TaxID=1266052 RepID=UPI001B344BCE|nr:PspC domain-containing protein [Psychrosphaera aestuarii]